MTNRHRSRPDKNRKLVVVGDGMAGKTCLLYAFKDDTFDSSQPPTIFETYAAEVQLDDETINLALFDTAGQEIFARLRPLSYPDTNVILICYSIDNRTSATNVIEEWNPEVRHYCGNSPVILVACKIDLRNDPTTIEMLKENNDKPLTTEEGRQIASQINAQAFMECSAKTRENVHELFMLAARLSMEKKRHRCRKRCFLF